MRAREFVKREQPVDEFVQALAPIAGAVARGAAALGGTAMRGLGAAADAVGGAVKTGANAVGQTAQAAQAAAQGATNIKKSITGIKNVLQTAGGGNVDADKLSQALATQAPGQALDPASMKALQGMIPALGDALKNPATAATLKQALATGVNTDTQQQAQQQTQQKPQSVGSVGSSPNTVGPA